MAHTKAYINIKIENCQRLVDEATSEDQKKVYQGYLDFWNEKLPKKERPEEIAKKAEIKEAKAEAEAKVQADIDRMVRAEEADKAEKKQIADEKAIKKAKLQAQLAALEAEEFGKEVDAIITKAVAVEEPKQTLKEVIEEFEEDDIIEAVVDPEELNEINFEKKFPNKKAYRTQNGDRIETIAYKEYLNNSKSESE